MVTRGPPPSPSAIAVHSPAEPRLAVFFVLSFVVVIFLVLYILCFLSVLLSVCVCVVYSLFSLSVVFFCVVYSLFSLSVLLFYGVISLFSPCFVADSPFPPVARCGSCRFFLPVAPSAPCCCAGNPLGRV